MSSINASSNQEQNQDDQQLFDKIQRTTHYSVSVKYPFLERITTEGTEVPFLVNTRSKYKYPNFTLTLDENDNFVLTELDEGLDTVSYCKSGNVVIKRELMRRMQHDVPLSYFCEVPEKDMNFAQFYGSRGDKFLDSPSPDILTPDFAFELGTTTNPYNSELIFRKKWDKYIEICSIRNIGLKIVSITPSQVCHNTYMNDDDCERLSSLMLYGKAIKDYAKTMLNWIEETDQDEFISHVEESLGQIKYDFEQFSDDPLCNTTNLILEPDPSYRLHLLNKSQDDLLKVFRPYNNQKQIDDFIESVNSIGKSNRVKSVSPTCQFSLPLRHRETYSVYIEDKDEVMNKFWLNILDYYDDSHEEGKTYAECEKMTMEIKEEQTARNENAEVMKERHLYRLKKDTDLEICLAISGISGKKHCNLDIKLEKQQRSREPMVFDTSTDDIDRYMKSFDTCFSYSDNPIQERLDYLINYSDDMNHNSVIISQLLNTRIGSVLTTFSAIISEININSKKRMKSNEWSLVRHPVLECMIAIHTTKPNGHIFYTILMFQEDVNNVIEGPFQDLIILDDQMCCTPILSLNHHDISVWLSMPNLMMSSVLTWADISEQNLSDIGLMNHPMKEEVMMTILLSLENKECTSSQLFNSRYMYMEMLKPAMIHSNPFKVLSKFSPIIRSRLQLWSIKRIINSFKEMLELRSSSAFGENRIMFDKSDVDPGQTEYLTRETPLALDTVPNLISFVSGKKLTTFEQALNVSYIGVFHNVEKGEQMHGYLKIFSKVIGEEIKLRDSRIENMTDHNRQESYSEICNLQSHEYSPNHVRFIARAFKNRLNGKGINGSDIRRKIFLKLSQTSFSELATFKASANAENFMSNEDPNYEDYEQKKRNKAMEEVIKIMEEIEFITKCPYSQLGDLLEHLKKASGVIANLFKKNQSTGTREIFVLTMISRIVIRILETISRTLCSMADNEYLTKGGQKSYASASHFAEINRLKKDGDVSITISDSCDATTWCQRFIMNVFQTFFNEFFKDDEDILKLITYILNYITKKRLELPKELLDLFRTHEEQSMDPNMVELSNQFLGLSDNNDLMDRGKILMKNRSNFMQGILHFTSSLIHSAHMFWFEDFVEKLLLKSETFFSLRPHLKLRTKTKVSSDDSSRQTTIILSKEISHDKKIVERLKVFLFLTSTLLTNSYPLFSAKLSVEKSTTHILCNIEEFNSEWMVVNTIVTPKIKWAFSSQIIQVSGSMSEKQNIDHNLINDLTQNGCRRDTTQICEFGCMLNHYVSIGLYSLKKEFFDELFSKIFSLKSNMAGFYFLSHHFIGTTLGFQCTKWTNLKKYEEVRKSEYVTMKNCFGVPQLDGTLDFSLTLPIGFGLNYRRFLDKLEIDRKEVDLELDGKERILFNDSVTLEDDKLKIKVKALGVGASKAFSFANSAKQHATCAYINTRPCLTGKEGDKIMKYTLPSALKLVENNIDKELEINDVLYPQRELYQTISRKLDDRFFEKSSRGKRRRLLLTIRIPNSVFVSHVPLLTTLQSVWFNMDVNSSKFQIIHSMEKYKSVYSWLTDNFDSSYELYKEQFGDISKISFSEHITNMSNRESVFKFHHPGKQKSMILDQIFDCMSSNYKIGYICRRDIAQIKKHVSEEDLLDKLLVIESKLAQLSTSPPTAARDHMLLTTAMLNAEDHIEDVSKLMQSMPVRLIPLYMISKLQPYFNVTKTGSSVAVVVDYLSYAGRGVYAFYSLPQSQREDGTFFGKGIICGTCNGNHFKIEIVDNVIIKITCNKPHSLYNSRVDFSKFLSKLKLKYLKHPKNCNSYCVDSDMKLQYKGRGIPLTANADVSVTYPENITLSLSVNKRAGLSIKFRCGGLIGDTITFYPQFRQTAEFEGIPDPILRNWLNDEVCSGGNHYRELIQNHRKWCTETIRLRAIELDLIKKNVPCRDWALVDNPDNELYDDAVFNMDFNEDEEVDVNLQIVMQEYHELQEFNATANEDDRDLPYVEVQMDEFGFDERYEEAQQINISLNRTIEIRSKPFWDGLLRKAEARRKTGSYTYDFRSNPNMSEESIELLVDSGFEEWRGYNDNEDEFLF